MALSTMQPRTDKPDDSQAAQKNGAAVISVPFVRASDQNIQGGNVDVSRLQTANQQDLGVFDVTSYGHMAYLTLLVQATGSSDTANDAAGNEDAPWNVLQNLALTEPNGAYIVQFNSGYELLLANKYGGYFPVLGSDPRANPIFSAIDAEGNYTFALVVPVQVSGRDGLGSLPNQDSAGQFKFRVSLAASATVYSNIPDIALPTVRIRAWLHAWDQPEVQSAGMVNATAPPASGTTSFWQVQSGITVNAGENTIELKRKGNYIRQIVFVLRRAGTSRSNGQSDWPAETRFLRDAFPARYYNDLVWRMQMWQRTGYRGTADTANAPENGVRFHDYMNEFNGELGYENRDLWQPTRGSTRLEIAGNFANAGTLTVLTNDVAIAEDVFL